MEEFILIKKEDYDNIHTDIKDVKILLDEVLNKVTPTVKKDPEKIYSVIEAAKYVGVSRSTFEREYKRGSIKFKRIGRLYRFKQKYLDEYMEIRQ